uniref:Uncharacterized protein n=1 Tax=Rhizophora mucronata TaxID=61149 RepID=A0A2P2LEF4_RHIMU
MNPMNILASLMHCHGQSHIFYSSASFSKYPSMYSPHLLLIDSHQWFPNPHSLFSKAEHHPSLQVRQQQKKFLILERGVH